MAGRKPKFNPEIQQELCAYIEQGLPYKTCARLAGIHPDTFRRWRVRAENAKSGAYFSFHAALTRARENLKLEVHKSIFSAMREGDWRAGLALLERRHPEQYSQKRILEHAGALAVNSPQEIDPSKLSPEKQALLYALLDEAQGSVDVAA